MHTCHYIASPFGHMSARWQIHFEMDYQLIQTNTQFTFTPFKLNLYLY